MKASLYDRIWRRESGDSSSYASLRGIYGSREWVDDLDIVNQLGGHTGCVNALCWSQSGQLLASGSDDKHVNLYSYQPESSTTPFALNTTIDTGHRANIFSVKFMPHSNDRTLVTCAGDSQVRVFDIEYSNGSGSAASVAAFNDSARSRRFLNFFQGSRYLNETNTNARVYRSHADRAKRIVTESSPHLFLTCSEDGEVRQWDLRQPSSAYPPPVGGQGFMAYRPGRNHDDSNVPPPLISYKKYQLDLNTISCSSSQPHYIALGGAHLHCFLHDRRMLGRDQETERGSPGSNMSVSSTSSYQDDEAMSQATRCVRRFAPNGQRKMHARKDGHITACKISDANPNEMVTSWSGDHIYSFDLLRSPDARDMQASREDSAATSSSARPRRRHTDKLRKRKRQLQPTSTSSADSGNRHGSRRRPEQSDTQGTGGHEIGNEDEEDGDDDGDLTFRVRYGNGESEDISLPSLSGGVEASSASGANYIVLSPEQRTGANIARGLMKLRGALLFLDSPTREAMQQESFVPTFTPVISHAAMYLPKMTQIMNEWSYPLRPSTETVYTQQSLRRNRQAAWRFVQAAGAIARVLGSSIEITSEIEQPDQDDENEPASLSAFEMITPAPGENGHIDQQGQFKYDFLKAILLWAEGGRPALLSGFRRRGPATVRNQSRYPIPETADENAIKEVMVPYLQDGAGESSIVNVDASRFEHDSTRVLFLSERAAVDAFAEAIKPTLENGDAMIGDHPSTTENQAPDQSAAKRFWVLKVGRGLLMDTGTEVTYEAVNRAFGGIWSHELDNEYSAPERWQNDADANEEEEPIEDINIIRTRRFSSSSSTGRSELMADANTFEGSDLVDSPIEDVDDDDDDDDEYDSDEEDNINIARALSGADGFPRPRREEVEQNVPCDSHTRVYRGHCNVKTVKDVNFYGLNDEYVVSGSDSGHLFIWNRQSGNLVNILEGDGEVVNVIQGHPYEPMIAASGIDNTVKIFSPDRQAQDNARRGVNILDPEHFSDFNTNGRGLSSCKRLHESYQIMSQNDVDRQGGMSDAFVTIQRSMLARIATTLRNQQVHGEGDGATLVVDPNCTVDHKSLRLIDIGKPAMNDLSEVESGPDRRQALACSYCRSKKIKCSRTNPCANCHDRGEECTYPLVKRRVGSKRDKSRKDLEERLARMEYLLQFSSSANAATSSADTEKTPGLNTSEQYAEVQSPERQSSFPSTMLGDSDGIMAGISTAEAKPSLHPQLTQETSDMLRPLPASTLAQPENLTHQALSEGVQDSSQHVECADLLGTEVGWEYHGISWVSKSSGEPGFFETAKTLVLNIDSRLKMRRNPRRETIAEPDEGTAWKWCKAYFEHSFDASLGLVSQQHFEIRLRHHFIQRDDANDDDPAWYALRNTVYASGCRLSSPSLPYSNISGGIHGQAWRYFEKAFSVHTELLYCDTGLMAVQALISMSFFAEGLGSPSLGYMLSSCAMRLAQAKGLHRQPAQSWNLPQVEQQHRIRLFWTLYILEKHISYRSGRPSHARISSRITKQLASGKSFHQTHARILETIQELNTELQEWHDSLPSFLQPDAPTTRHEQRPPNINMYHVMYLRYAYYGSVMAIHSILTHPWNSSLFGPGQTAALQDHILISSHVVVNAARSIILDTNAIHVDASTPIWLAFFFPLVSAINIFIYILKYPALPTASSDLALLDIATGHFSRLELVSPDIALPFVREIARLARATVECVNKVATPPSSLLRPDLQAFSATPSLLQNSENIAV